MVRIGLLLLLFTFPALLSAQESADSSDTEEKGRSYEPLYLDFKPRVGLGVGMFTFYGDIADNHRGYHPTVSRVGYDLRVTNPITNYLDLSFYVIFGKLGANERSTTRNLNFESDITTGGMALFYNFHHMLDEEHKINPYLMVGIESFEFLSKTDRYDAYGNEYFYWSDGSIRNLPESPTNEPTSIIIQRDYTYESDIREMDLDGFGKYPERSWAIPVGIGANFDISERWKFRIGTSMHFALTDLVDGVTDESVGNRAGDGKNDKFLFTSFALNYDLILGNGGASGNLEDLDLFLVENQFDLEDKDGDGVEDFKDRCPNTPEGTTVDIWGCGIDTDGDNYADNIDDEVETPRDLINTVDSRGVGRTDEDFLQEYLLYLDSGYTGEGQYEVVSSVVEGQSGPSGHGVPQGVQGDGLGYVLLIGGESQEVSPNDLAKLLAYKNFRSYQSGGTVFYILEGYETLDEAAIDQYKLSQDDLDAISSIAHDMRESGGSSGGSGEPFLAVDPGDVPNIDPAGVEINPDRDLVLRVQIGAFSRPVSDAVFVGVPDLVYVKGEDGLYRYYSGMFDTPEEAAKHKVDMVLKGYEGAFIVGYENGERKTLTELGFDVVEPSQDVIDEPGGESSVDKELVNYRVQVGAYNRDIPTEAFDQFLQVGNNIGEDVKPHRGDDGITRYVVGTYKSRSEANAALMQVKEIVPEAFVVGEFNGNIIPADEADKLLNE